MTGHSPSLEPHEARQRGYDYIHAGLFGQIVGALTVAGGGWQRSTPAFIVGVLTIALGTVVAVVGFARFARHFNFSPFWGVLGCLNLIGYITIHILVRASLPRHSAQEGFDVVHASPYTRDIWRMDVKVLLDSTLQIDTGPDPIQLQLPRGASIKAAMDMLATVRPQLAPSIRNLAYKINENPADLKSELHDTDTLFISGPGTASSI